MIHAKADLLPLVGSLDRSFLDKWTFVHLYYFV